MEIKRIEPVVESNGSAADRSSVRAVHRALCLLDCFSEVSPTLTLSEFARKTRLPVSTVSRLLSTLESEGIIRRNRGGSYSCGTRLLQIGLTALQSVSTYDVAESHLRRLTDLTGESSYLGIPSGERHIVYVRHCVSPKAIRHTAWLGRSVPREGTAIGAAMSGRVNPKGFAATRRTIEADVTAVAAPVRDASQTIVAGISIVGPTFRIGDQDIERFGAALVEASIAIAQDLGVRLPAPAGNRRSA